jgi:hypothetical protein
LHKLAYYVDVLFDRKLLSGYKEIGVLLGKLGGDVLESYPC